MPEIAKTQFTLRSMFVGMVIAAMAAWILYQAGAGSPWARGATFGMFTLVVLVIAHVIVFLSVGILGQLIQMATGERSRVKTQNPFATAAPPPRPLPAEVE